MADTKLSALTELAATPANDDEVYIRDVSEAASAESKRITIANLLAGAGGATLTVIAAPGTQVFTGASPTSFADLDLSGVVGSNVALVILKISNPYAGTIQYIFRANGETEFSYPSGTASHSAAVGPASDFCMVIVHTDSSGVVEWNTSSGQATTTVDIVAYIK